jgi:CheY-like chemotaxis protein
LTWSRFGVLPADDDPIFRDRLRSYAHPAPAADVVGEAATGPQAVEQAFEPQPDVVVRGLHLFGANGIEATRRIVECSPHVGVLVLTMFDDDSGWLASAPLPLPISSGGLDSSFLAGLSRVPCGRAAAQPSGRVGALPLGGLAILEACCFVGAAGGVASTVRMSAGTR